MKTRGQNGAYDAERGVYGITVAAELVGMGEQTLRLYESRGLLTPERTGGGTRLYSDVDLERLRHVGELLGLGLNLAGVSMVLELEAANRALLEKLANARDGSRK
jgi:DNA-binding transcriptional MerR regulator